MPTIIDALVITLGYDTSGLKTGQKEAESGIKATEVTIGKTAKVIAGHGKEMADMFGHLKNQVVGLLVAFAGYQGIVGLAKSITSADAAMGLMSKTIGMSVEDLSSWGGAAERLGGSTEATTATFGKLSQEFQNFALTGQSSVLPVLQSLFAGTKSSVQDAKGNLRPLGDIVLDIADMFKKMSGPEAAAWGARLGFDQGTINLLMQGSEEVAKLLEKQKKMGTATEASSKAFLAFLNDLKDLQQVLDSVARDIIGKIEPSFGKLVKSFTEMLENNKKFISQNLDKAISAIGKALDKIDWEAVGKYIRDATTAVVEFIDHITGSDWDKSSDGPKKFKESIDSTTASIDNLIGRVNNLLELLIVGKIIKAISMVSRLGGALSSLLLLSGDTPEKTDEEKKSDIIFKKQWDDYMSKGGDINKASEYEYQFRNHLKSGGKPEEFNQKFNEEQAGPYRSPWEAHPSLRRPEREDDELKLRDSTPTWFNNFHPTAFSMGDFESSPMGKSVERFSDRVTRVLVDFLEALTQFMRGTGMGGFFGNEPSAPQFSKGVVSASYTASGNRRRANLSGNEYENADADLRQLMALGWSREQALGIIANISAESSGNERGTGDNGLAYGLAQWQPDRQRAFARWAGHDIRESTREEQIGFIDYELRHGGPQERKAGAALSRTTDAPVAAAVVSRGYERPKDVEGEADKRAALAELLSRKYAARTAADLVGQRTTYRDVRAEAIRQSVINNQQRSSSNETQVHIGQVTIHSDAADGRGLANDFAKGVRRETAWLVPSVTTGLTT